MLGSFNEFDEIHKSCLQEIGNMCAGNAATEVSNMMLSSPTDISTPQVRINPQALAAIAADKLCVDTESFLIELCGDMKGSLMFVFPFATIERIVSAFFPDASIKSRDDIDEMAVSTVRELVNIAAASYANNMALMSGMMVDISVPQSTEKPSKAINEILRPRGGAVCSVKNSIEFLDTHNLFEVMFYPELDTIKGFMGKIGLPAD